MTAVQEIDVIRQVRSFLYTEGLQGTPILDLYTDAHPSLIADVTLRPFQRFSLVFDGFIAHPDLVGRLTDGETLFAVEAKGTSDLLKGIAQADLYRAGFHLVLFASAGSPSRDLITLARQRAVGILAVYRDRVELIDLPPKHLPQLLHAEHIRKQFTAAENLQRQFYFNLPTHYLCFAPLLRQWYQSYGFDDPTLLDLEPFARQHYPVLPSKTSSFRAALSGAEKLGLVRVQGRHVHQTFVGQAAAAILPDSPTLARIHTQLIQRSTSHTLSSLEPTAGALLRCFLYADPIARLLIDTLMEIGRNEPVTMHSLVMQVAERDKALAPTIFFQPEAIAIVTDDQGALAWHRIQPQHFRATIFMQYKSILKHAGILRSHRLGGTSAKSYDPDQDIWELIL